MKIRGLSARGRSRSIGISGVLALALCGGWLCAFGADAPARIGKASGRPFADGRRVEGVWSGADTLTGFIVPERLDVAMDQTSAQLLHDGRFLYLSLRGSFEKGCGRRGENGGVAGDNHFELCVARSRGAKTFRRFAFSEGNLSSCGDVSGGRVRKLGVPKGMEWHVIPSDGLLEVNVRIPLSSLGAGDVRQGAKFAFLLARRNICFRDGYAETSAWGALPGRDMHADTSCWSEAVVSADGAPSRLVFSPCGDLQVNYFANPDFDVDGRVWKLEGGELSMRCETSPMSREWIFRTMGGTYRFFHGTPMRYERNTEYTLVVRARGVGGESQMNILELYRRDGDGKISEGPQIARHVLLGERFHTYYFPFRSTDNGDPCDMVFYKWEPKDAADRGIEVSSVRLFRGKVRALDIRRPSMNPRKAPQGRGAPIAANPYGRLSAPLRGLVFSLRLRERREILEVFEGTGIEVDVLNAASPDQDIYYTFDDPDMVKSRLQDGRYDFYFVMSHVAGNIGPEVAAKVLAAVEGGAGLYFMNSPRRGHFEGPLKGAGLKHIGQDSDILKSYPRDIGCGVQSFNPSVLFWEGRIGKGRVFLEGSGRIGAFKFAMNQKCYGETDFPYSSIADPLMVKILRRIARNGDADAAAARTHWTAVDAFGMVRRSGEAADDASALERARAACDVTGRYAVSLRRVDAGGATVDWNASYIVKDGPRLELSGERISCSGDDPAVLSARVEGAGGDAAVRWTLEDFSGRVIESGSTKGGSRFEVPTKALFTNKGVVRAYLEDGGRQVAVSRIDIYARDRDWQRLSGDFTVGIWGQGSGVSRDSSPVIDRLLQEQGVIYQCNPVDYFTRNRNLSFALASGMAVGGGYLGKGDWFFPKKLDGSNVRSSFGPINTEKGRETLRAYAKELAKEAVKFGPISYAVCDEPNLSLRFTRDEPDEDPENVAEFRRRMEARYGTLEEYNRRHRTSHGSFAEVGPVRIEDARRTGGFAEYVEWRNFNVDRWCEAIKTVSEAGASVDPTCRLSLFNSFGQTAVSGNDYWKLLTKAGLGFSNEYTAMVYMRRNAIYNFDEFYRSFRPDMRVWGFTGYTLAEPQIRFLPWWFAAHRYGGFTWFSVLTWDWRFLDQPTLAYTEDAMDLKRALEGSRMTDGLGRLSLSYGWAPRHAAIYYSHDSLLVSTLLGTERVSYDIAAKGPLHDYMYSRQGIQYTLEDLLYQYDFIAPEQVVSGGRLKDFRIVFMPRILALSDAEVAKLKAFAAAGGRIVADTMPGDYDELGVKRAANPFSPGEVTVTGETFDDLSVDQRRRALALLGGAGAEPVLRSAGIESVFGREAMHFTDGVNSLFFVLRMPSRSKDSDRQRFVFPRKGHLYDVRARRYLGFCDSVEAAVPLAEASVWAVLPKKVGAMRIASPDRVAAGGDLVADISLDGAMGRGVFHVEVVSPTGECRFHMKRNIDSSDGKARFTFRMAANDLPGRWTLRVSDPMTGTGAERRFILDRGGAPR